MRHRSWLFLWWLLLVNSSAWQSVLFLQGNEELNFMENNKSAITIFLASLFIFALLPGTSISANGTANKQEVKQQKNPYANAQISIKIIPSVKKTFGYDILLHGRPLIHQPNIPGLPGNEGFTTKGRAQKVAEFVVKKIRKNEMPPTVTIENLNSMGVLK
jgi:hypothetical protein